jgi:hypothetical protein
MNQLCAFPRIRLQTLRKEFEAVPQAGWALSGVYSLPAYEGVAISEIRDPTQWSDATEDNLVARMN